jgi:hypothetical protein
LTNISNIIRTGQIKHINNKAEIIIITEVFRKALKAIVTLKVITVSEEAKAIINITYLYVKKSVIFVTS